MPIQEQWKPIKGYEGEYLVSDLGRILSLKQGKRRLLVQHLSVRGYPMVGLWKQGVRRPREVHRLVAIAFLGNPEELPEVNHINSKRDDPRAENLEWVTHEQNQQHASKTGAFLGKVNPKRGKKLCHETAKELRAARKAGQTLNSLAALYGVSRATVIHVARGDTWR